MYKGCPLARTQFWILNLNCLKAPLFASRALQIIPQHIFQYLNFQLTLPDSRSGVAAGTASALLIMEGAATATSAQSVRLGVAQTCIKEIK